MEKPKYKLDFEVDPCFDIKEDITINMFDGSKIVLYRSKTTNKGSIFFEVDTLNQKKAEDYGKLRVNYFLNCMLVALNIDSLVPPRFPKKLELLNLEEFKGKPITMHKDFKINGIIGAPLGEKQLMETSVFMNQMNDLDAEKQAIIHKCLFWLRKGAETRDDERFIYRWISLEALLAILQKSLTEKMLSALLNNYLKNERAKDIVEKNKQTIIDLSEANLVGWKGAKYSEGLKEILKQQSCFKAIMVKAVLCIYEVRNKLFHRGEIMFLLAGCNSLLRDLIKEILKGISEKPTTNS
jgi:hypothetical protein